MQRIQQSLTKTQANEKVIGIINYCICVGIHLALYCVSRFWCVVGVQHYEFTVLGYPVSVE